MAKVGRPMGKLHQDDVRSKIQASLLVKKLQDHALSADEDISQSQMKAIEILLRKSLPDLSAVTLVGDKENPIEVHAEIFKRPKLTREEWLKSLAK